MALLHPDSDLSLSFVFYGAEVLHILRYSSKKMTVDDLLDRYLIRDRRGTPQSFFSTLDMLYASRVLEVRACKVFITPQVSVPALRLERNCDLFKTSGATMIRRLWSPSGLFDKIEFHAGVNLIMGRYAERRDRGANSGINGIDKSSVVRLIDFLLLSDASRRLFTSQKSSALRLDQIFVRHEVVAHAQRVVVGLLELLRSQRVRQKKLLPVENVLRIVGTQFFLHTLDLGLHGTNGNGNRFGADFWHGISSDESKSYLLPASSILRTMALRARLSSAPFIASTRIALALDSIW